ncbi:MAG: rRNA processing protein RimM [Methylobacteriaceae bacterium]|nr:rRNA processing protein RimM [Methylobacteriaceae bacterium]
MTGSSPKVLVGVFGAAHGIRGEIRLKSFTADPKAIGMYQPLHDETGTRGFILEALRPIGTDMFVARVKGVPDRKSAEALNGIELFVPRDALPSPDDEEFYHTDLIGLRVENERGESLGSVVALHNFGAGDILEIAPPPDAPDRTTAMLAFTRALVPVVDVAGGRVVAASDPFAEEASYD